MIMEQRASSAICLTLNCGSSSIKFSVYALDPASPPETCIWQGRIESLTGPEPRWVVPSEPTRILPAANGNPYLMALQHLQETVVRKVGKAPGLIVHRVVHGGDRYFGPTLLDATVLADLRSYIPLAPLHQPYALDVIDRAAQIWPEAMAVACFDTAFHRTLPRHEQMLPLPQEYFQQGIRRYGFHGLSYESIAHQLRQGTAGLPFKARTIVAHLGSGASLCAMRDGVSVATSMGFSALDGLMMGSRSGALDPGVLLHLIQTKGWSVERVSRLLYQEAGLLGVSGLSADPRVLLANESHHAAAKDALTLYVNRIASGIASLVPALGGLECLIFTAGVGENNAEIRQRVCAALDWLGVCLEPDANAHHAPRLTADAQGVQVAVMASNEEGMMARHAHGLWLRRSA